MSDNYRGPYKIGTIGDLEGGGQIMRHNDGCMIIMGKDEDDDNAPVLHVPMRVHAKRGEAWRTADPEQEAFAAALVDLMNKWGDLLNAGS